MQIDNSDAVRRADSISLSGDIDEIDLYPDLCRFMDLSPARVGQRHQPDSKKPHLAKPPKHEFGSTPTHASAVELELTKDRRALELLNPHASQEKSSPESSSHVVTAQTIHLDGMSPLEVLESLAFEDQGTFSAVDIGADRLLSQGVCLACGAESEPEDLFCITCGTFLDGVATGPTNPTCAECGQRNIADEIFCPWCGSSLPAE